MLATVGDLGLALTGADLPADIRDLAADFYNWEWTWEHAGETALDGIGVVPIIGLFKYGDEIGDVYKVTKKGLSKVDDYVDVMKKALSKSGDDVNDIIKHGDDVAKNAKKWSDSIKATQELIPGTNIPKSFIMGGKMVNGKEIWVHGNATKHMGQFVNSSKSSILVENELMTSFQNTVSEILPKVKSGRNFFNLNGWEIGINGDTGVIYHALFK